MDNVTKLFKVSAFGFNKSDVINYIEKTRNDFYDYKIQTQRTIDDLNEKIKELEEALKSKDNLLTENKASDEINFLSSVSQINEAADHLRETADKICDDIGDFLDRILSNDKDDLIDELLSESENIILDSDEIITEASLSSDDYKASDDFEEKANDGFLSQFSQIIDNAFVDKTAVSKSQLADKSVTTSILDGLLGNSVFSE